MAEKELHAINQIRRLLPGDFNIAASSLYGGRYQSINLSNQQWGSSADQGFSEAESQRIFKTAIALSGTEEMFQAVMAEEVRIVASEKRYFEVVKVEQPHPDIIAQCSVIQNTEGKTGYVKALGRLHVKAWDGPDVEEEDMTDDEDNGGSASTDDLVEAFLLEHDILDQFFVGLKMEAVVHELNIGIKFIDYAAGLYCSFHTSLPNEKMSGWKEPSKFLDSLMEAGRRRINTRTSSQCASCTYRRRS